MGALREVLTAQYARLAQLLEDAIARLVQDTEVLLLSFPVCFSEGHLGRMCGCMLKNRNHLATAAAECCCLRSPGLCGAYD